MKRFRKLLARPVSGFTLIEMMIVVAIVGILAAVAYPSYQTHIRKSRRADAVAALSQYQVMMERCYAQYFSYSPANCSALPVFPLTSTDGYYSIALSNSSATTYTLSATAIGSQAADTTCATMMTDQINQRLAMDASGAAQPICWHP